jgi:hypothetical protein
MNKNTKIGIGLGIGCFVLFIVVSLIKIFFVKRKSQEISEKEKIAMTLLKPAGAKTAEDSAETQKTVEDFNYLINCGKYIKHTTGVQKLNGEEFEYVKAFVDNMKQNGIDCEKDYGKLFSRKLYR